MKKKEKKQETTNPRQDTCERKIMSCDVVVGTKEHEEYLAMGKDLEERLGWTNNNE